MANERCDYCKSYPSGHKEGCPVELGTPQAMAEWERGYTYGWEDNLIQWYDERYYSKSFIRGYYVGKNAIDTLVDKVAQRNYSYHNCEY